MGLLVTAFANVHGSRVYEARGDRESIYFRTSRKRRRDNPKNRFPRFRGSLQFCCRKREADIRSVNVKARDCDRVSSPRKILRVNMKQSQSPRAAAARFDTDDAREPVGIGKWDFPSVAGAVTQYDDRTSQRRFIRFLSWNAYRACPPGRPSIRPSVRLRFWKTWAKFAAPPTKRRLPAPSCSPAAAEVTPLKLNFTDPLALPS